MNALVASIIRTLVPHIVTQIASLALMLNINVPDDIRLQLSAVVGFVLFSIYYGGVRVLEQQWPSIGILLGLTASPDTYTKGDPLGKEAPKQVSAAATSTDASTFIPESSTAYTFPKTAVDKAALPPVAAEPIVPTIPDVAATPI